MSGYKGEDDMNVWLERCACMISIYIHIICLCVFYMGSLSSGLKDGFIYSVLYILKIMYTCIFSY